MNFDAFFQTDKPVIAWQTLRITSLARQLDTLAVSYYV